MKRAIVIVVAGSLLLGVLGKVEATLITYDFVNYPADQSGWTLSGSITTDGHLGFIGSQDIISWNWTASNGAQSVSFDSSQPNAWTDVYRYTAGYPQPANVIWATPTELTLPFHNQQQWGEVGIELGYNAGGYYPVAPDLEWWDTNFQTASVYAGYPGLWDAEPASDFILGGYVVAAVVPEPASLTVLGISAVCALGYTWRRRK
jgi:PEP-CTERM motif